MSRGTARTTTKSTKATSRDEIAGTLTFCTWFSLYFGVSPRSFIIEMRGSIDDQSNVEVEVNDTVVAVLKRQTPSTTVEGIKIRLHSTRKSPQGFAARPF